MRGMRNKVIHDYFDVDLTVVWGTVKEDLPKLKQQIDALLIVVKRDPAANNESPSPGRTAGQ